MVVLNDEIHAARFVQKTHTSNLATFRSPLSGPIGYVFEDNVRISTRPVGRYHIDLPEETRDHPVALYTVGLGDDGRLLGQIRHLGYEGLVIEAFGVGHVTSVMVGPLESLANEMPVVLASRTGSGEVHESTYGFTGSESDLLGSRPHKRGHARRSEGATLSLVAAPVRDVERSGRRRIQPLVHEIDMIGHIRVHRSFEAST